jgi:thiamine pyrophosphate-dependent acetolactate synthase large subunit-like protein
MKAVVCPADHRSGHAAERALQQKDRLCGDPAGCNVVGTAYGRDDRSPLRVWFSRTFGDMGHPGCPKALTAKVRRLERKTVKYDENPNP